MTILPPHTDCLAPEGQQTSPSEVEDDLVSYNVLISSFSLKLELLEESSPNEPLCLPQAIARSREWETTAADRELRYVMSPVAWHPGPVCQLQSSVVISGLRNRLLT